MHGILQPDEVQNVALSPVFFPERSEEKRNEGEEQPEKGMHHSQGGLPAVEKNHQDKKRWFIHKTPNTSMYWRARQLF